MFMWLACSCEGHSLDRKRESPSCHLLPMWQGVGRMISILSAEQRASRRPALLEMSFRSMSGKSKQRQGKKRRLSRRDRSVWAPPSSLLVILHYLLKNNIVYFNTRCGKNQLSGPLGFLPMLAWGVSDKWEDQ